MNPAEKQQWKRYLTIAAAVVGLSFVGFGFLIGTVFGAGPSASPLVWLVGLPLALLALVGALWKVRGRLDADAEQPLAWAAETFATPAPERTPDEYPLSSGWLAGRIEEAGRAARSGGTVDDGLAVVRPPLREVLGETLVAGGTDPEEIGHLLATGEWTDDRLAASVLDEQAPPPRPPVHRRLVAWLFPERTVRERTRRAVHAIAEVTADSLPTVPGQTAPRTVPVRKPRLEELRRDATGEIRGAVDPDAISHGPDSPDPAEELDDESSADESERGDESEREGVTDSERETARNGDTGAGTETDTRAGTETDSEKRIVDGQQLRYRGAVAAAIFLVAAGVVDQNGTLVLAAAIPVAYLTVGALSAVDAPEGLVAERRIQPQPARPGETVTVTLSLTNGTGRTLTDVRVADRVPEDLAVLEGTPRAAATLEPGEEVEVRYLLIARRGEYPYEPPEVRLRGLGAGAAETRRPPTTGDDRLVARLDAGAPPIEEYGRRRVGTFSTDEPGQGVVFHSVREHQPDDPADRIDWRHYAKRGELATVSYECNVSSTVVLVLDARLSNRVVSGPGRPTAVELSAYAATRAMTDLLRGGHDVAVAVLGIDGPGPAGLHWLPPAAGSTQQALALEAFRTAIDGERGSVLDDEEESVLDDEGVETNTDEDTSQQLQDAASDPDPGSDPDRRQIRADQQVDQLLELVSSGAQVALFSPLLDGFPVTAAGRFRAVGIPVTVLSPDTIPANTVSGQYAAIRRWSWLVACQRRGARVYDWRRGTPLPLVVEQAFAADARLPSERITGGRVS